MTRLEVLFLLHNFSQCGLFFFGRWENFVSIFSRRFLCSPDWKKTTIRRIAVREAGISRHNGGPPTPKIPRTITATIVWRCLRGALNWASIMPRESLGQLYVRSLLSVSAVNKQLNLLSSSNF